MNLKIMRSGWLTRHISISYFKTKTAIVIAVLFAFSLSLLGQNLTGDIGGTVHDSSGAVIPDAVITVRNTDQNLVQRTIKSNSEGEFIATLLSVGNYSLSVSASGFQTLVLNGVAVHADQPVNVPIVLPLGTVSASVTVTTVNLSPQLESAAAGDLIDGTQVRELSLSSRNFEQLLSLQPGITGAVPGALDRGVIGSSGKLNTAPFSVNGQVVTQNGYFLDGVDLISPGSNDQTAAFPSVESLQEMTLLRNSYGAQYGGNGSVIISMQSKGGSTDFHGGAYEFFRSQVLNANNFFNNRTGVARPGSRYNDYGYQLGGPVWIPGLTKRSDARTFFFFGQEILRQETANVSTITNIPTAAQRQGNFGVPVCTGYNSSGTCTKSATSITAINPIAQAYLTDVINKFPLPNSLTDPQGLTESQPGFNNETQTFIRIDQQFNQKLSVFFRYLDDPFNLVVPNGLKAKADLPVGVGTSNLTTGDTIFFGHVAFVFNPKTVIEGGISTSSQWTTAVPIGLLNPANSPDFRPPLLYTSALNRISDVNINGLGFTATGPYNARPSIKQIFTNMTRTAGRATLYFGFSFEGLVGGNDSGTVNAGSFGFATSAFPTVAKGATQLDNAFLQSFANFLQGKLSSFEQTSSDATSRIHRNVYEGYAQGDIHATERLTLNGGVRYSLISAPISGELAPGKPVPTLTNFSQSAFNASNAPTLNNAGLICTAAPCAGGGIPNPSYDPMNGIILAGTSSPYGAAVNTQAKLSFAPRLGFALDVFGNGKTSFRGGYGIYFTHLELSDYIQTIQTNPPGVQDTTYTGGTFSDPIAGSTSAAPLILRGTAVQFNIPYVQTWSLDVQQQLAHKIILDIGYYGDHSVHQPGLLDLNQPRVGAYLTANVSGGAAITAANSNLLNLVRPYKGYSSINVTDPIFTANYNSLQTSLAKNFDSGSLIRANYTWSRALANTSGDGGSPQDIYNTRAEYGPTSSNRANVLSVNYVYRIPFFTEKNGIAGQLVGGWETSGIISYASGQYLTATSNLDPGGLGLLAAGADAGDRPNAASNPNKNAPHNVNQWFNPAAFANAPTGQPGNAGVGTIVGPGYEVWNLSLFKNIKIVEGLRTQFRAESFNSFNHTNLSGVTVAIKNANFGQPSTAGDARVLQLAVKLNF
jgi:hypothetical protein